MEILRESHDRRADVYKAQLLQDTQNRVLELIARGGELSEVLDQITRFLEQQFDGVRISVLLVDRVGGHLRQAAAPSLPAGFNEELYDRPIGPNVGSCGTAAYLGEEVVVTDIATDSRWEGFREQPLSLGLRACWSTPLLTPERVVAGTFAVYYLEPRGPTEQERAFVRVVAHLAEVAATSQWRLEDLHERERRLEHMADFRRGIIEVMEQALLTAYNPSIYQHMLDEAVRSIPGAQAGSLLIRGEDGRYGLVAVNGYDYGLIGRIRFSALGVGFGHPQGDPHPRIVTDLKMDVWLTAAEVELLRRHGRADDIRAALVVPIQVDGSLAFAYLTLDNFTSGSEFTSESVESARIYAGYAGLLIKRASLEESLQRMAFTDSLTGLPNRARFRAMLNEAMAEAESGATELALLFLDLDNLKEINDSLGHLAGDQVLAEVAERLRGCLAPGQLLARLGGDEFTMLIAGLNVRPAADELARRASQALFGLFEAGGHHVNVTASIGISLFPHDGSGAENLLRRSDIAMYHGKQRGKNRYVYFTPDMERASTDGVELQEVLHQALEEDRVLLHYQPRIDIRTGRISCLEALVRVRVPGRDLMLAGEFIELAEGTSLIHSLGRRVLDLATRQLRAWRDQGLSDLRVAVNLSAGEVGSPDLVERVTAALHKAGLSADALEIEVVERVAMTDVVGNAPKLAALRAMGVRVALDDFELGFSNLSYLRRLPIDTVKVDGTFVKGVGIEDAQVRPEQRYDQQADFAIVQAVVTLGKSMGLTVVAEGIETRSQWDAARALGCDEAQGFLIGRPAPPEDLAELLARGSVTV